MSKDCLFCRIVDKKVPAKIVFDNDDLLAFEDIKPQAPVHILIVPKRHIDRASSLTDRDSSIAGNMVLTAVRIARERSLDGSGYRMVFNCEKDAGQEVFHIHLHLLGGRKFGWPPG